MTEAAIALGSNIGERAHYIMAASEALSRTDGIRLKAMSRLYKTKAWGETQQRAFLNACLLVETDLSPENLLDTCLQIERGLGRTRRYKWGPREIDLDVLYVGEEVRKTETLTLPHPYMLDRAFVLVPLAEIAPAKVIAGASVAEHVQRVDRAGITAFSPPR